MARELAIAGDSFLGDNMMAGGGYVEVALNDI